jgi:hypothetical protein
MFNAMPLMSMVYAGMMSLFNMVSDVQTQAADMANTIAPSQPEENVVPTGLQFSADTSQNTFGPLSKLHADFKISQSEKIQNEVEFTQVKYKLTDSTSTGWVTDKCTPRTFTLKYPIETQVICDLGTGCDVTKPCETGYTNKDGKCCPNNDNDPTKCKTLEASNSKIGCISIGSHSVKARAIYKMVTSSSYRPIFVDTARVTSIESGAKLLAECGLQDQTMPIAKYLPSNSPAELGIVLSQDKMPVAVSVDGTTPSLLSLKVSLNRIHDGFVSKLEALTVNLPSELKMDTADDLTCDFALAASDDKTNTYKVTPEAIKRVLVNPEKHEPIIYRCNLKVGQILGKNPCTPVTITAVARYDFTLEASTSIVIEKRSDE